MRKVLYFIAYPHRLAGANRSLFELVTNLPGEQVRAHVLLTAEGPVAEAYQQAQIPVTVLPTPKVFNLFGRATFRLPLWRKLLLLLIDFPRLTFRLWRFLRDHQFDVVHVNDPRGLFLLSLAAKLRRVPIVAHLRGEFSLSGWMKKFFERLPDHIIAVSEGVRQSLSSYGQKKTIRVYNGIGDVPESKANLHWLQKLREEGVAVISCFAQLVPFKGQHHLFDAAAELNQRGLGSRFVILCLGELPAGYEDYHAWLWQKHHDLKLHNVTITGWQASPFSFYRHSDVAVLASVSQEKLSMNGYILSIVGSEGFPRTHLEAMHFGLPIVGTRIAGVPEQVAHSENGLLVDQSNATQLADALQQLIETPSLRQSMGANGRERVAMHFSTAAYVRGVLHVYDKIPRHPLGRH